MHKYSKTLISANARTKKNPHDSENDKAIVSNLNILGKFYNSTISKISILSKTILIEALL